MIKRREVLCLTPFVCPQDVCCITQALPGGLYFIIEHDHVIMDVRSDFTSARRVLHASQKGHYIIRGDGVVLAFMSTKSSNRMPTKIPPALKRAIAVRSRVSRLKRCDLSREAATPSCRQSRQARGS